MLRYEDMKVERRSLEQQKSDLISNYKSQLQDLKARLSDEDASLLGASLSDGLKVIESYATLVQNLFAYCDEDIDDSVEEDATEQVIKSLVTMREECQSITQDLANMAANIQKSLRK
ncbi:hypothetical protein QR680_013711 [Steinernema hermaphroditum]|uniref:Uncharacterized protein n=1 Tax=Steinernema hermaphroditum TaxID=289476 RepID=A0AA39M2Z9_9BILA|nr:hypothetical protein QR680_013711 [Steinernema hermaphroditum]